MLIAELARIALRYDTAMSRAMLRACGVPAFEPRREGVPVEVRDPDIAWCFANHGSPMDRL